MRRIWPFRHAGLKLLSLALALLLWMVVSGEETVERGLRVPLELQQVPAGLELTGDIPTTVDVRVRGSSGTLSRVAAGDVVAILDLRTARAGQRLFPLTPDQMRVPFGIEVVQITPSAVAMAFERSAARQVRVVPAVYGRPAPGYVVGAKTADPKTVEVVGPESAVANVTEVLTEPVPVSGARERVVATVVLGLVDPSLRLKDVRSAEVTVEIVPAPLERVLHTRPVHLRGLGPNLEAQAVPATVDIAFRGPRESLNRLPGDAIVLYIDLTGLGVGEYSGLDVHAESPPDIGVTRIQPASVQVTVKVLRGKQ
jgi:YbbR domain-containing protein